MSHSRGNRAHLFSLQMGVCEGNLSNLISFSTTPFPKAAFSPRFCLTECRGWVAPLPSGLLLIIFGHAHAVAKQQNGSASRSHVVLPSHLVLASWAIASFFSWSNVSRGTTQPALSWRLFRHNQPSWFSTFFGSSFHLYLISGWKFMNLGLCCFNPVSSEINVTLNFFSFKW